MALLNTVCLYIAEFAPLVASVFAFVLGIKRYFKKGKALYPQIITMGMGIYALGTLYHLCQSFAIEEVTEGFTLAYLGRIGFFLFLLTANYGQMDGIVDDKSRIMRPSRILALIGPVIAILILVPSLYVSMQLSSKISYCLVTLPACFSLYFNLKHALIPDMDFGFVKAIRPYNICATVMSVIELLYLLAWSYYDLKYGFVFIAIAAVGFSVSATLTMHYLDKGVKQWTI